MSRRVWLAIGGASALLNLLALGAGRGSFVHVVAVMMMVIYLGVPGLIVAALAYSFRYRRVAQAATAAALVCISLVISIPPGRVLATYDIAAAKENCESLVAAVDQYQKDHGNYPLKLSAIAAESGSPRNLEGCYYWSDGAAFQFTILDPRGIMNFIGYSSQTRAWSEWH